MEHEEQYAHPTYLKGFNEGYTMTKYMPDLAKEIASAMRDTERGNGFRDGSDQYAIEAQKDARNPDWLKDFDKEPRELPKLDKDDREPGIE